MFPGYIQKIISSYMIFGVMPLDKILHFVVGAIVTIILRAFKVRISIVFLAVLLTCIIKEMIDLRTLQSRVLESIIDTIVTFLYPIFLLLVMWIKKKSLEANQT